MSSDEIDRVLTKPKRVSETEIKGVGSEVSSQLLIQSQEVLSEHSVSTLNEVIGFFPRLSVQTLSGQVNRHLPSARCFYHSRKPILQSP